MRGIEVSTPNNVLKTLGRLAPAGSSPEKVEAAMGIAANHHGPERPCGKRRVRKEVRKTGELRRRRDPFAGKSSEELSELYTGYRETANRLYERAKTDPSLSQPQINDDGERCASPISALGFLRASQRQIGQELERRGIKLPNHC